MAVQSHDPSLYEHRDLIPVRRALISVSDKTRLLELAEALAEAGVEIVSTGSTAAAIRECLSFLPADDVTEDAETLRARLKGLLEIFDLIDAGYAMIFGSDAAFNEIRRMLKERRFDL